MAGASWQKCIDCTGEPLRGHTTLVSRVSGTLLITSADVSCFFSPAFLKATKFSKGVTGFLYVDPCSLHSPRLCKGLLLSTLDSTQEKPYMPRSRVTLSVRACASAWVWVGVASELIARLVRQLHLIRLFLPLKLLSDSSKQISGHKSHC